MNTEQKLKAVIRAQVSGRGCTKNRWLLQFPEKDLEFDFPFINTTDSEGVVYTHILEILLDTEGCKAAYGSKTYCSVHEFSSSVCKTSCTAHKKPFYKKASVCILDSWNSGEGNNYKAAINTAYELL